MHTINGEIHLPMRIRIHIPLLFGIMDIIITVLIIIIRRMITIITIVVISSRSSSSTIIRTARIIFYIYCDILFIIMICFDHVTTWPYLWYIIILSLLSLLFFHRWSNLHLPPIIVWSMMSLQMVMIEHFSNSDNNLSLDIENPKSLLLSGLLSFLLIIIKPKE